MPPTVLRRQRDGPGGRPGGDLAGLVRRAGRLGLGQGVGAGGQVGEGEVPLAIGRLGERGGEPAAGQGDGHPGDAGVGGGGRPGVVEVEEHAAGQRWPGRRGPRGLPPPGEPRAGGDGGTSAHWKVPVKRGGRPGGGKPGHGRKLFQRGRGAGRSAGRRACRGGWRPPAGPRCPAGSCCRGRPGPRPTRHIPGPEAALPLLATQHEHGVPPGASRRRVLRMASGSAGWEFGEAGWPGPSPVYRRVRAGRLRGVEKDGE